MLRYSTCTGTLYYVVSSPWGKNSAVSCHQIEETRQCTAAVYIKRQRKEVPRVYNNEMRWQHGKWMAPNTTTTVLNSLSFFTFVSYLILSLLLSTSTVVIISGSFPVDIWSGEVMCGDKEVLRVLICGEYVWGLCLK